MSDPNRPSTEDFAACRSKILEIVDGSGVPITTGDLAQLIERSPGVVERYCDRLKGEGRVRYVQVQEVPGRWGWIAVV